MSTYVCAMYPYPPDRDFVQRSPAAPSRCPVRCALPKQPGIEPRRARPETTGNSHLAATIVTLLVEIHSASHPHDPPPFIRMHHHPSSPTSASTVRLAASASSPSRGSSFENGPSPISRRHHPDPLPAAQWPSVNSSISDPESEAPPNVLTS